MPTTQEIEAAGMAMAGILTEPDDIFKDVTAPPPAKMSPAELRSVFDDAGVTFGDCVEAFGVEDDPIIEAARLQYHRDGEIEIDDITVRSGSDGPGDYVMAWVWVYSPEEADTDFTELDP
jgi:hypothetical protein